MVGDAVASLGVPVAGVVILVTDGSYWLDPLVSIALGLLLAWKASSAGHRRGARIDPEGSQPRRLDACGHRGRWNIHDLHVWSLSTEVRALSAHLVLAGHPTLEEAQTVSEEVKQVVAQRFSVAHATFEFECEPCLPGDPGCTIGMASLRQPSPEHRGHAD